MYRMALDSIQVSSKEMRCKIQKNIGLAFVKLGFKIIYLFYFEIFIKAHFMKQFLLLKIL